MFRVFSAAGKAATNPFVRNPGMQASLSRRWICPSSHQGQSSIRQRLPLLFGGFVGGATTTVVCSHHNITVQNAHTLFFSEGKTYAVGNAIIGMHEKGDPASSRVSQAAPGELLTIKQRVSLTWARVETADGYQGFVQLGKLNKVSKDWEDCKNIARIQNRAGLVYRVKDTELPEISRLPLGAKIRLVEPLNASTEEWREVILPDGSHGYIQQGDIEALTKKSFQKIREVALSLQGTNFYSGGRTSIEGYDSSGFIKMLYELRGITLPRESKPQSRSRLLTGVKGPLQVGDLLFFGNKADKVNHVAMYIGDDQIVHSTIAENKPTVHVTNLESFTKHLIAARRVRRA